MEKLISIQLGFENIETIDIDMEDIDSMLLQGIENELYTNNRDIWLRESERAKKAVFVLKKTADKDLKDPINAKTVFERIKKFDDMTDVLIRGTNGYFRHINFDWDQASEYSNSFQTNALMNNGNLIVVVDKEITANDVKEKMTPKIIKFMGSDAT